MDHGIVYNSARRHPAHCSVGAPEQCTACRKPCKPAIVTPQCTSLSVRSVRSAFDTAREQHPDEPVSRLGKHRKRRQVVDFMRRRRAASVPFGQRRR